MTQFAPRHFRSSLYAMRAAIGFAILLGAHSALAANVYIKTATSPPNSSFPPPQAGETHVVDPISADSFDSVMRDNAVAGSRVYIYGGCYITRGYIGFAIKNNTWITGSAQTGWDPTSGKYGTTLRLDPCAYDDNHQNRVLASSTVYSGQGAMRVMDLEIDCNATQITPTPADLQTYPWMVSGVELNGLNDNHIERVHVKNAFSHLVECFIISIVSPAGYNSVGNIITQCTVDSFYNPYGSEMCSAISLNKHSAPGGYIMGTVSDCTVVLNGILKDGNPLWRNAPEYAYNATRMHV